MILKTVSVVNVRMKMITEEYALDKIQDAVKNYRSTSRFANEFEYWDIVSHSYIHMKQNGQFDKCTEENAFCWAMYAVGDFVTRQYKLWEKGQRLDIDTVRDIYKEKYKYKGFDLVDVNEEAFDLLEKANLSGRQRLVLGMKVTSCMSYRDIGKAFNFTHQRARQIYNEALYELRLAAKLSPEPLKKKATTEKARAYQRDYQKKRYHKDIEANRAYHREYTRKRRLLLAANN